MIVSVVTDSGGDVTVDWMGCDPMHESPTLSLHPIYADLGQRESTRLKHEHGRRFNSASWHLVTKMKNKKKKPIDRHPIEVLEEIIRKNHELLKRLNSGKKKYVSP